jgi:hypothetical protein
MHAKKRIWLRWLLGGIALVTAALAYFVWLVFDTFDGGMTLDDFDSNAEALAFVSDHLTEPLPQGATVTALRYDRFTDWHLEATVKVSSPHAYVGAVRGNRGPSSSGYCNESESATSVSYFLAKWHACGTVWVPAPDSIALICGTH